uniref:LTD domain-containing protein n=1 Tax=Pelusios castaneus TaxID=367368 RepID=A0A8C8R789_9SAUR
MASATGARRLMATGVLLCMLLQEASVQNLIKKPRAQKAEHLLLINEINADNPGEDTSEFVELYHTSGQEASLDNYYLVFYNGNGNLAYKVLNLQGKATDSRGFFLVGSSTVKPQPSVILPKNTIQNGPDAIALYYGKGNYQEGMRVTSDGLVDALVHKSRKTDRADVLLSVLTPDRDAFLEDPSFRTTDESIERCHGEDSQWIFQVALPTPGLDNHCIPSSQLNASAVLISEVHAGISPGESGFIELQGPSSTALRNLVLVLINGWTKEVYFFMDVYGKTSPEGLFLIGPSQAKTPADQPFPPNSSSSLLDTGSQAVALYFGNSSSFTLGKAASATNLLDAFVYMSNGSADPALLEILTPGRQAFENKRYQPGNKSMSRCSCCSVTRDPSVYVLSSPTPGQFNDCPSKRFSQPISLCLHVADCQQWLPRTYEIQMALAQALDKLCSCGMSAAYLKDPVETCQGTELAFTMLLTAKSPEQLSSLAQAFTRFLESPRAASISPWNASVEKACFKDAQVTDSPSGASVEGTHEPSSCTAELLINEVNPDNPGGQEDMEYVELLYTRRILFDLRGYWLVLYNGKNNQAYRVVNLTGHHTNELGFFLVGGARVTPQPGITLPSNTIQNGADAVALYHSTTLTYGVGMDVTEVGLVDAVVYTSRLSERADKMLKVLTPGQNILYEDNSHSSQDESLSRCNSQSPRLQSSFQVTTITPFGENVCTNSSASSPSTPSILINELSLANGTTSYQFIELKGKPGTTLRGYTVVLFSGQDGKAYASIPLQGTIGATGLFVMAPAGASRSDQQLPFVKDAPSVKHGSSAVAVYNSCQARIPVGMMMTLENLVDALVYTWESNRGRGQLNLLGPSHFVPCAEERPVDLSRCSCCNVSAALAYAISDPTPGLENHCPLKSFAVELDMCLLTPNCSVWTPNPEQALNSLAKALTRSIEENCVCGVSQFYLQELNFTCTDSMLQLSGQVWAKSLEQQHLILNWRRDFLASLHPFPVDGRVLKMNKECITPGNAVSTSHSGPSFQTWEIALFVLGSVLLTFTLVIGAIYYFKRHPLLYTTIEMNDQQQMTADF